MTTTEPLAEDVAWDLEPLLPEPGEAGVLALLDDADAIAATMSAQRGKVAQFDADALVAFMEQLATLHDTIGRAGSYAALRFSTEVTDPARGALMQKVRERSTAISTRVLFFELEWAAVDDATADALLADDRLAFARHHLRAVRRYRPHLLSEPEEVVIAEKDVTGSSAFQRLFEEQVSTLTVPLDGETVPLDAALARLHSPDREERRRTAEAVTAGLEPGLRTRGVRLQHAARRQGHRGPAAQVPVVDRGPEPRQRGERRIGAGARRRGATPLRHPAALVRAEGAVARHRPARRLRPARVGRHVGVGDHVERGA